MAISVKSDVWEALQRALPSIAEDCTTVLGSEQHYQAMIYHCLREKGQVPVRQLGMNVKMGLEKLKGTYRRTRANARAEGYRGFCEPIPDIAFFKAAIAGDWRRRRYKETFKHLLGAVEIKVSERDGRRLRVSEVASDIRKLAAHREERHHAHKQGFYAAVLIIDSAPEPTEQMTEGDIQRMTEVARGSKVDLFYLSPNRKVSITKSRRSVKS